MISVPEPPQSDDDIEDEDNDFSDPVGVFALQNDEGSDRPFRIHHLHRLSAISIILVISARHTSNDPQKKRSNTFVEFDLICVKIDLLSLRASSSILQPKPFDILWQKRGPSLPFYTTFVQSSDAWLVLSESTYVDPNAPTKPAPYEPTPDEIAPTPRTGENLDAPHISIIAKPHPYSWTQMGDSVTIAFPLPASITKNDIKVIFTTQTLTVHVNADEGGDVPIPHCSAKLLWDQVNPSVCFWTWDKEGEKKCGLLTLHMEKKNEGTRWMQVFANRKPSNGSTTNTTLDNKQEEEDEEVLETLDPSELWHIRESLEKYTAALQTREDSSGLGLGRGMPSLATGEMDDEVDANVGRRAQVSWFGSTTGVDLAENEGRREITILSTPLPGLLSSPTLLLKRDLDGTLYTLSKTEKEPFVPEWEHTSTYPALAFVLASKQDTRFVYHVPPSSATNEKGVVLAFESGTLSSSSYSTTMRGGNLYIYHPPPKAKENWAAQAVLKVDEGPDGALMGVGGLVLGGVKVIICLTEGSIVLLKGL